MKLTQENYYSVEANKKYMSASQFKDFIKCESAAMAKINGEIEEEETNALLLGKYFDSFVDGELDEFRTAHPEMFKKDGTLKADFIKADEAIERVKKDRLFMMMLEGEKQKILTDEIGGVKYKGKLDVLLSKEQCLEIMKQYNFTIEVLGADYCDGCIVDTKYMKDCADIWDKNLKQYVPFWKAYGYDIQGAIYQKLEGHGLPFVLAVVTKETTPDIKLITIPQDRLDECLSMVEVESKIFQNIKDGKQRAMHCGECDYCRTTKMLEGIEIPEVY